MTRAELEDAIRGLVQPRLAITTIWARKKTATGVPVQAPADPYAALNLVSDVAEGLPDGYGDAPYDEDEETYLETLTEDRYARCSVKVYGAGAWDRLQDLRLYLQTSSAQAVADTAGVGLAGIGDVTDLTALDGAGWEEVAGMDLRLHRRETVSTDEGYMESVTSGLAYQQGATTVASDTVSVDSTP